MDGIAPARAPVAGTPQAQEVNRQRFVMLRGEVAACATRRPEELAPAEAVAAEAAAVEDHRFRDPDAEAAALEAELESAGPQPSQPREPNTAAQAQMTAGQAEHVELMGEALVIELSRGHRVWPLGSRS